MGFGDGPGCHVQRRGQRPPQFLIRSRLDLPGTPAAGTGGRSQLIEQNGLADPAESGEHHAAFRPTPRNAFTDDVEGVELLSAPGEFGWTLTCAGCIRVAHGVHNSPTVARLSVYMGESMSCPRYGYPERVGSRLAAVEMLRSRTDTPADTSP